MNVVETKKVHYPFLNPRYPYGDGTPHVTGAKRDDSVKLLICMGEVPIFLI